MEGVARMQSIDDILGGTGADTFLGFPAGTPGAVRNGVALIGVPAATPYAAAGAYCANAPKAIRRNAITTA